MFVANLINPEIMCHIVCCIPLLVPLIQRHWISGQVFTGKSSASNATSASGLTTVSARLGRLSRREQKVPILNKSLIRTCPGEVSCNRSIICDHGLVIGYAPTDAEWSNTLNMAGKQRTLAQLMTNEFLLAALGIHPQENKEKMEATISLFGATLQNLMFGNSSDQILAAPTNVLEYLQNEVLPVYTSMASLLSQNTGSSPGMSVLYVPCRVTQTWWGNGI